MPLKLQHAAMQNSIDHTRANFEKNKELSNHLEEIRGKCKKEINGLLGSEAKEYREFHEKRREIARTMQPLFSSTPEGQKIKSQFQKTRLYEANKFMKSLGINTNDFKSILSKYQQESKSIIDKARSVEGSLKLEVAPIPAEVVQADHPDSPWRYIHPPYFYSHGDAYVMWDGPISAGPMLTTHQVQSEGRHYENHLTGEVSCSSYNAIIGADDYETQLVATSSVILIYFQMPAAGQLNIWSQWQCVESSHGGSLSNDWGWSDATIMQSCSLFMSVGEQLGQQEAHYRLLFDERHTDEDVDWSSNMAMPGEYKTLNLVTDYPYSAGQWILLRAGIFDYNNAVLNDMTYSGRIANSWILNGIWVSAINT